MSSRSKRAYLEAIYSWYKRANRKGKAIILDEFCTTCKYSSVFSGMNKIDAIGKPLIQ